MTNSEIDAIRIQAQLRASARRNFDAVPVPPFTCFFNPDDRAPWSNYAIPDAPVDGDLGAPLAQLTDAFCARGCLPRFEYIEAFAPRLAQSLAQAGFRQEAHTQLMVCTRPTFTPAPPVPGLAITQLAADAPVARAQDLVTVQRRAFGDDGVSRATAPEAEQFRTRFQGMQLFLADLDNQPVAVASLMQPHEGISEIAGIATLAAHRRRGIATALTAHVVRTAFDQGLAAVFLTAADAGAGRVYERVGFRASGSALAYIQEKPND
jgi:ribosomal protein S18 acetylase RimI-like enzyme